MLTEHLGGRDSKREISRRRFLRGTLALGAAGAAGGLVEAAYGTTARPEVKKLEPVLVRLLWLKNVEFGGFWAALDRGWYADVGLDPTFLPGGPGVQVVTLIAAGGEQIGLTGDPVVFVKAVVSGARLKCFGANFQQTPAGLVSLPDRPVRTAQDLVGKRIGLQPGARTPFAYILKKNRIREEQVTIVPVSFDPTPLIIRQVDAFWSYLPNQPNILRDRGFDVVTARAWDLGYRYYGNIMIARESTLEKQRDIVVRWTAASQRGWEYNNTHPEEIARLTVRKISPELNLSLAQQVAENREQIPLTQSALTREKGLFWMDPTVWEEGIKDMVDNGELEKPVDVNQIITLDILTEAAKLRRR